MDKPIYGNQRVLNDVANAMRARRGISSPVHDESVIRTCFDDSNIDRFAAQAEVAGMQVTRTRTSELLEVVSAIVEHPESTSILLEPALAEERPELNSLPGCLTRPTEDELFTASVGIVSANAGIAETGSIVRAAGATRPRGFALVPMTIVVVLDASKIVGDLYDWISAQDAQQMASEIVLITGPSKTADIGMNLVTGIHGPGIVHIALVQDA